MELTNAEIAKKLRQIAAAYILKEHPSTHSINSGQTDSGQSGIFQIRAYEIVATAVEWVPKQL